MNYEQILTGEQLWVWYIQDIWAETEAFRWYFYSKMKRGKAESLKLQSTSSKPPQVYIHEPE